MKSTGIHHVSVMARDSETVFHFYHKILGLKLTMKTVNQDDAGMPHLFFGDQTGREGTEFTVFTSKTYPTHGWGTNGIERVFFYVPQESSLSYWLERFNQWGVSHHGIESYGGESILRFSDKDGIRLGLVVQPKEFQANPWVGADIPEEHAIGGIGRVQLRVRKPEKSAEILEKRFGFEQIRKITFEQEPITVLKISNEFQHEVHLIGDDQTPREQNGVGGIHHLAFGVPSRTELLEFQEYLDEGFFFQSGIIDREFFSATYFREANTILFEVSTPIVGADDRFPPQDVEYTEIPLWLPKFLEGQREEIEAKLVGEINGKNNH